jgi:tryptophan synthase alpha chain
VPAEVDELVSRIKQRTKLPVCVGFGISKPEHVKTICKVADGAVIGSWLVDLLHRTWNNGAGKDEIIAQLRAMKEATLA